MYIATEDILDLLFATITASNSLTRFWHKISPSEKRIFLDHIKTKMIDEEYFITTFAKNNNR